MATRRQTFRLYPNQAQEKALFDARRLHCYIYNACVAHRRHEWRANKKSVSYFEQQNCLPAFKKEWPEFTALHSQALQATIKRVDLAYNSFFKGLRGLPKFKKKGSKRQKQKAGLNKSILSVGFGTLNQMIAYKIESKGGLMLMLPTKQLKPSQRCPNCGKIHSYWADLSNRYHVCHDCGLEIPRDRGSVMVMYNVAIDRQPGLGTSLVDCGCFSSTDSIGKRKHTGSMKQLGQMKRQKSNRKSDRVLETPSVFTAG